ncbi:MAG: GNAT family N-acetyltransferase [Pseudomonadota bacterium]
MNNAEIYGDEKQLALLRRAALLWRFLREDPRYSYYGRVVSLADPEYDALEEVVALVGLQGASSCQYLPVDRMVDLIAALDDAGIQSDPYDMLRSQDNSLTLAQSYLTSQSVPREIQVVQLDSATAPDLVTQVAALQRDCGVMPITGSVMRGQDQPSIFLAGLTDRGQVVATAAAIMSNHQESEHATEAFWGLLATHPDHRGRGLALWLGARAMVDAAEQLGAASFFAGVRASNQTSLSLCRKLGLDYCDKVVLACTDRQVFGSQQLSK